MKRLLIALVAAASAAFSLLASADTLYAASGSNGIDGSLYRINPATGAATLVGPIRIGGVTPVGLTGLAFSGGTLYGLTTNDGNSPNRTLVTVNQSNGDATVIGSLGATQGSDLTFGAGGVLYTWLVQGVMRLATVNLATGLATPLGPSGVASNVGGGLAFSPSGTMFLSALGTTGALHTLNTGTGVATAGPILSGAPVQDALNAMAFNAAGTLYAINTDRSGSPTTNFLVTVNTTTGVITNVGALPGDMDGLAFAPDQAIPTLSQWALVALATLLVGFGLMRMRASRRA